MRHFSQGIAAALCLCAAAAPAQDESDLLREMERAIEERDRQTSEPDAPSAAPPAAPPVTDQTDRWPEAEAPAAMPLRRGRMVDGGDVIAVLAAVERLGPARLTRTGDDRPVIVGVTDGIGYALHFEDCTDGARCRTLRLAGDFAGRRATPDLVALWNRERRFAYAFLGTGDMPRLQMDIVLEGGVSPANLDATLAIWRRVLGDFADRVGR